MENLEEGSKFGEFFNHLPLPFDYYTFTYPGDPPKKRHPHMKFYLHHSGCLLIVHIFKDSGLTPCTQQGEFNVSWGQQYDPPEYQAIKSWQKISHFAGISLIGLKNEFKKRMEELQSHHTDIEIFPKSYLLPEETQALGEVWSSKRVWIVKPFASARGEGISIAQSTEPLPQQRCLVQTYIEHPFLVNGKKVDLRIYLLITSISPLKIYIFDDGLARFASENYSDEPNLHAHLTNYSFNKDEPSNNGESCKWLLSSFLKHISDNGANVPELMRHIERVAVLAILSGASHVRHRNQKLAMNRNSSIELLGMDIVIDSDLRPWVVEVNITPSMNGDSPIDSQMKSNLLAELLNIARVIECDPSQGSPESDLYNSAWKASLAKRHNFSGAIWDPPAFVDYCIARDFIEEKYLTRRFRRIYPKRRDFDYLTNAHENKSYSDRSLQEFVRLSNADRLSALQRNELVYRGTLEQMKMDLAS